MLESMRGEMEKRIAELSPRVETLWSELVDLEDKNEPMRREIDLKRSDWCKAAAELDFLKKSIRPIQP